MSLVPFNPNEQPFSLEQLEKLAEETVKEEGRLLGQALNINPDEKIIVGAQYDDQEVVLTEPNEGVTNVYRLVNGTSSIEDLYIAQGESELLFPLEYYSSAFNEAYGMIIKTFGHYIDPDHIKMVFPTLDLDNIDSFDFYRDGKIKLFMLDNNMFNFFVSETEPSDLVDVIMCDGQFRNHIIPPKKWKESEHFPPTKTYNVAGLGMMLVRDIPNNTHASLLNSIGQKDKRLTHRDQLIATLIHEGLHSLDIAQRFERNFREAIVGRYSALITHSNGLNTDYITLEYPQSALLLDKIVRGLVESGLSEDDFNMAIIGDSPKHLESVITKLVDRYGQEAVKKLMNGAGPKELFQLFYKD